MVVEMINLIHMSTRRFRIGLRKITKTTKATLALLTIMYVNYSIPTIDLATFGMLSKVRKKNRTKTELQKEYPREIIVTMMLLIDLAHQKHNLRLTRIFLPDIKTWIRIEVMKKTLGIRNLVASLVKNQSMLDIVRAVSDPPLDTIPIGTIVAEEGVARKIEAIEMSTRVVIGLVNIDRPPSALTQTMRMTKTRIMGAAIERVPGIARDDRQIHVHVPALFLGHLFLPRRDVVNVVGQALPKGILELLL